MTSRPPLDQDLYYLVSLHAIIEIEVAIRHTWLNNRSELEALREVRTRAEELAKDVPIPSAGERIADMFFDAVELECSPKNLLDDSTDLDQNEYDAMEAALKALWKEQYRKILKIGKYLPAANRFRLGDLSWQNHLPSLLEWRIFIDNAQPHEIGPQTRVDESGMKYIECIGRSMPARIPCARAHDNFAIYDADADNVTVNGQQLQGCVLVMVDTNRQINNFYDIVDTFGAQLGLKQSMYEWRQLENGILPNIESLSVFDYNRRLKRQRDSFEIQPRKDRAEAMLKGLICWDLHNIEKKKLDDACEDVGLMIENEEVEHCDAVRANYNTVRQHIRAGKLLQWKQRTQTKKK